MGGRKKAEVVYFYIHENRDLCYPICGRVSHDNASCHVGKHLLFMLKQL